MQHPLVAGGGSDRLAEQLPRGGADTAHPTTVQSVESEDGRVHYVD